MSRTQPPHQHQRRTARLVYRPDHFLVVIVCIAVAIVVLTAGFLACLFG